MQCTTTDIAVATLVGHSSIRGSADLVLGDEKGLQACLFGRRISLCVFPLSGTRSALATMSSESQLLIPLHVSYIKALGDVRGAIVYGAFSNEHGHAVE